ncbi:hypothetical protein B0H14DRAFT_3748039 [Mycena olivaceomarginata]|nr:hypothetical protein B0H14DRAFT_3748039 [Mycena olivaceomarginata]
MSTEELFPPRKPAADPPQLRGTPVNGRPTPTYALAWHCSSRQLFQNLGGGELGKVDDRNFSDVVTAKWHACPPFDHKCAVGPIPYPGMNNNFYLIAMFNERNADHLERVRNLAEDPLIRSARIAMGVDLDPVVDKTLQWIRWRPRRGDARWSRITHSENKVYL